MATIKEFRAMMYDGETVGDISSVIAPHCHAEEQELIGKIYSRHPFNIMRLEHPEDDGSTNKYAKAAETLKKWLETGIVIIDDLPSIYIYEQEFENDGQLLKTKGLVCKVKIEDGVLAPHEEKNISSYSEYKSDRYNLMSATNSTFSSVLSMYKDEKGEIAEKLETKGEPVLEFTDGYDVTHRVWTISAEDKIDEIKQAFADKTFVIADGHIRYETAVNYYKKMKDTVVEYTGEEEFNYVMMTLIPITSETPVIRPIHRLLKNKNFDEDDALKKLENVFSVSKTYIREYDCEKIESRLKELCECHPIIMYTGKDYYYMLVPKEGELENIHTDTELLHKKILGNIFGVNTENLKNYVAYAYSVEEGERAVRNGEACCAFYVCPLNGDKLYGLAECGVCMPKRTNNFFPRLMTGIIMNKFDE